MFNSIRKNIIVNVRESDSEIVFFLCFLFYILCDKKNSVEKTVKKFTLQILVKYCCNIFKKNKNDFMDFDQ
jgi:hypothetical protein